MEKLKKYLEKHGTAYRPVEEWSLIFGNHPDGLFINADVAPIRYIKRLGLYWEFRGSDLLTVYVAPAK